MVEVIDVTEELHRTGWYRLEPRNRVTPYHPAREEASGGNKA